MGHVIGKVFLPYPKGSKTYAVQLLPKQKKAQREQGKKEETIEETDGHLRLLSCQVGRQERISLCHSRKKHRITIGQ